MVNPKLVNYVRETLHKGYSHKDVTAHLRKEGWKSEDIRNVMAIASKKHLRVAQFFLILSGLIAFIIIGYSVHLFIIEPAFVEKPELERPPLLSESISRSVQSNGVTGDYPVAQSIAISLVDAKHLEYILTELGAYRLHKNPLSGKSPKIEILVRDLKQTFTVFVEDNRVKVFEGHTKDPDVRVSVDQDAIVSLSIAPNEAVFKEQAAMLLSNYDASGYSGELLTSEADLLLKGYVSLYNANKEAIEAAGITGGAIAELPLLGTGYVGLFVLIMLLWYIAIVKIAISRDD